MRERTMGTVWASVQNSRRWSMLSAVSVSRLKARSVMSCPAEAKIAQDVVDARLGPGVERVGNELGEVEDTHRRLCH